MSTHRPSFLGTISSKLKRGAVTSVSSFGSSFGDSPTTDVKGHVSLRQLGRKASSYIFGTTGTAAATASDDGASSVNAYDSGQLHAHDMAFFSSSITAAAAGSSTGTAFDSTADASVTSSSRQKQLSLLLQAQSHSRQLSSRQPSFDRTGDMPLMLRVNNSDNNDHLVASANSSSSAPQRVGLSSLRKASSSIYSRTGSMVSAASTSTATAAAAAVAATATSDSAADRRGSTLQRSLSAALPSIVASRSRTSSFLRSGSIAAGTNSSSNSAGNSVITSAAAAVHGALPRVSIANLRSYSRTGSSFGASLVDTAHRDSVSAGDSSEALIQRSSSRSGSILASIKRMSVRSMSSMFSASQLHGGAGGARQSISETDFDDQVSEHQC
jgi:hypothetical protein